MARYISSFPKDDDGTHLYPMASVDDELVSGRDNRRKIIGPAYCGHMTTAPEKRDVAFDPHLKPDGKPITDTDFLEERLKVSYWDAPCSECNAIQQSGKLHSAEWQREFRSQYPEVFG